MTIERTGPERKPGRRAKGVGRRRLRARPVPRWLTSQADVDEMARRRVLMVLSVLSGEKPVTEVIGQDGLSRGTYYQLEEKALRAMLVALTPGSGAEGTEASALEVAKARSEELEERIRRLERDKRRAERLLYVTRKVVKPGPVTTGRGRKRGPGRRASTTSGSRPSSDSPRPKATPSATAKGTPNAGDGSDGAASIRRRGGGDERSAGSESLPGAEPR